MFESEDEAISIASNTCYGLVAEATRQNFGRVQRIALHINSGDLMISGSFYMADGRVGVTGGLQRK